MQKLSILILLLTSFLAISCNSNTKNKDVRAIISGPSSKTWHPTKQTDASGDKIKLTDEEKKESWIFFSNGQVSMNMGGQNIAGRWTYDPNTKVLSITQDGNTAPAQTFTVKDAEEDELDLLTGDGSAMRLKTD